VFVLVAAIFANRSHDTYSWIRDTDSRKEQENNFAAKASFKRDRCTKDNDAAMASNSNHFITAAKASLVLPQRLHRMKWTGVQMPQKLSL